MKVDTYLHLTPPHTNSEGKRPKFGTLSAHEKAESRTTAPVLLRDWTQSFYFDNLPKFQSLTTKTQLAPVSRTIININYSSKVLEVTAKNDVAVIVILVNFCPQDVVVGLLL